METNLTESFLGKILEVQKKLPITIEKTEKGYNFTYTPLPDILPLVKPLLIENGLVMYQSITGKGMVGVRTVIAEVKGGGMYVDEIQIDRLDTEMAKMAKIQGIGAVITYVRRYAIVAFFNLATEEDADNKNLMREREAQSKVLVSKEQVDEIQAIDKLKLLPGILKKAGIDKLESLPVSRYDNLLKLIKDKNNIGGK